MDKSDFMPILKGSLAFFGLWFLLSHIQVTIVHQVEDNKLIIQHQGSVHGTVAELHLHHSGGVYQYNR